LGEFVLQASMPISLSSWTPMIGPPTGCSRGASTGMIASNQCSLSSRKAGAR